MSNFFAIKVYQIIVHTNQVSQKITKDMCHESESKKYLVGFARIVWIDSEHIYMYHTHTNFYKEFDLEDA